MSKSRPRRRGGLESKSSRPPSGFSKFAWPPARPYSAGRPAIRNPGMRTGLPPFLSPLKVRTQSGNDSQFHQFSHAMYSALQSILQSALHTTVYKVIFPRPTQYCLDAQPSPAMTPSPPFHPSCFLFPLIGAYTSPQDSPECPQTPTHVGWEPL